MSSAIYVRTSTEDQHGWIDAKEFIDLGHSGAKGESARTRRVEAKYAPQRMDLCGELADGGGDLTEGHLKCLSPEHRRSMLLRM